MRRSLFALLVCAVLTVACGRSHAQPQTAALPESAPSPFPTKSGDLPERVQVRPDAQGVGLRDPAFEALSGARAYFGHLGGTAYQIEVPDNWNGRLVLYMHGFQGLAPVAAVQQPSIRPYLIRSGFAWGASSYSSTALIPGRAADETAALWDEFVARFGRPQRTYVTGHSMGGAASFIAAERYGDRYDGVLGLCGFAGQSAISQIIGDYLFAGAYVAGVSQQEFDATPVDQLISDRIRPALRDPVVHDRWESILFDMTGGPRAFDREGFAKEESTNWDRARILVGFGLSYNEGREYTLGPLSAVSTADFNANVVRKQPARASELENFNAGNEIAGDLQVPLLTIHTTGDWQVPIDQEQTLHRAVSAAGKSDLLVQRVVRDPSHCGFLDSEWEQGLQDLVAWIEQGRKPAGEDVTLGDLRDAGREFTLAPRFGSSEASSIAGASQRVTLRGRVTIMGQPLGFAYIWSEVEDGGLRHMCAFSADRPAGDRFEQTLAADAELAGCGATGGHIRLAAFSAGKIYLSRNFATWPSSGSEVTLDVDFTDADATSAGATGISGNVFDASGKRLPPGTRIEAYIGDVLCGTTGIPTSVMQFQTPEHFELLVAGPDVVGCNKGASINFKINGIDAAQAATNTLDRDTSLDLTLR